MKKTNKWQVYARFGRDMRSMERGWKRVDFAVLRIHTTPDEGAMLHKKQYHGFWIKFVIWFPIDRA